MKKVAIMVVAVLSITIMITGCGKSDDSSSRVSRKKLLEKANDTAKLIYTSANNELSDLMVTGDISVDVSGTYNYKLTDTDSSDPIQDAVWTALENNKKNALNGSVYMEIENGYIEFVQWSNDDLSEQIAGDWTVSSDTEHIIGQYPDPTSDVKTNVSRYKWGKHNFDHSEQFR